MIGGMAKFEYKDGCLLCNQCGRLYEKDQAPDRDGRIVCPCGNNEQVDALEQVLSIYNAPPKGPSDRQS